MVGRHAAIVALSFALAGCVSHGPIAATGTPVGEKLGRACKTWILSPLLSIAGRNDIKTAARNGQVEKISIVDSEERNYVLYGHTCTNVYGH